MECPGAARCFGNGLNIAWKRWPVLLALYLGLLLPALGLAARPAWLLWGLADRPVMRDIAAGIPDWLVVDALGFLARMRLGEGRIPAGLVSGLSALTWAALILPLAGGLVSAFLYGGVLSAYTAPAFPGWRAFFAGCWRWYGCFLLLGFLQTVLFTLGLAILVPLALLAFARLGPWAGGVALVVLLLVFILGVILFEVTRVQAVSTGTRNPFRAFGRAAGLMARQGKRVAGFYALAFAALLGVHALFRLAVLPLTPAEVLLPALLAQQAFLLLRLFACAGRLAGLVKLAQSS